MGEWKHVHTPISPALPRSFARTRSGPCRSRGLVAAILRILPWLANYPLHHDEALYGYWARLIASGQDPLLLTPWIDKPPLTLYLLAASSAAFGASELALRLPGMIAGLLTVLACLRLCSPRLRQRVRARWPPGCWPSPLSRSCSGRPRSPIRG